MKLSWLFVILLLIFVAVFSVQNAGVITVRFLVWEIQISAALVIQLGALLGGLVGLGFGAWSRRPLRPVDKTTVEKPLTTSASTVSSTRPALPAPANVGSSTAPFGSTSSLSSRGVPTGASAPRTEKKATS
jgi:uncharacterized integral membrane protein